MSAHQRSERGVDELPPTRLTRLPRAAVLAAADAGLRASLLGDYLDVLVSAAGRGRRLSDLELADYRQLGRAAAESGAQLRALVDLYLSATWRAWPELPAVRGADDVNRLRTAGLGVLHASDDAVAALCEGYQSARQAAARAEEALRREFVDDLLAGTSDVGAMLERAAAFGLRLEAPHVVLVAAGSRRFTDGHLLTRDVEAALQARAGGRADLLVTTKDGQLVCVVPEPAEADDTDSSPTAGTGASPAASRTVAGRLAVEHGLHWRLGVSRARTGAGGIRAGYEEVLGALDLAERMHWNRPVLQANDLLVYQVLLRDREPLADLVETMLSPLRRARGGVRPLLNTLEAYFAAGAVAAVAARQLHLSVRALTYRLARIHNLTGYDPTKPEDRYPLQTAVLGARLLGWADREAPHPRARNTEHEPVPRHPESIRTGSHRSRQTRAPEQGLIHDQG